MNTKKIILPIGGTEIEIKEWITGREAEYIDELQYEALAVKADLTGKADVTEIDLKKIITETNHRKIETFVVTLEGTLNGKAGDILDAALSLHEQDYAFLLDQIDEQRKKK